MLRKLIVTLCVLAALVTMGVAVSGVWDGLWTRQWDELPCLTGERPWLVGVNVIQTKVIDLFGSHDCGWLPPRRDVGFAGFNYISIYADLPNGKREVLGWGVRFPTVVIPAALLIYPFLVLKHERRRSARKRRNECLECGYNLTGNVSGLCPGCGTAL